MSLAIPVTRGIVVANSQTGQSHKLAGSEDLDSTAWSSDGRFVVGVTRDLNHLRLCDLRSGEWKEFASSVLVSSPLWAKDSKSVYFQDLLAENEPIYRLWLADGRKDKIYDFHEQLNSGYFRCALYGMKPDGSLLIGLSRSSADLYAIDLDLPDPFPESPHRFPLWVIIMSSGRQLVVSPNVRTGP